MSFTLPMLKPNSQRAVVRLKRNDEWMTVIREWNGHPWNGEAMTDARAFLAHPECEGLTQPGDIVIRLHLETVPESLAELQVVVLALEPSNLPSKPDVRGG